jgi:anti-sigma factor RsiW
MKCSEIRNHITDYVLEELAPELQIQVNEHLAVCDDCRGEVQHAEAVIATFRDSARFRPAPDVYRKIAEQVRALKSEHSRLFGLPRNLVFAFGAFLLGIVITRSVDSIVMNVSEPSGIEVRQESPRKAPFSDTVEFYSVPAKNLARI